MFTHTYMYVYIYIYTYIYIHRYPSDRLTCLPTRARISCSAACLLEHIVSHVLLPSMWV